MLVIGLTFYNVKRKKESQHFYNTLTKKWGVCPIFCYLMYSAKSVNFMSPLRASVSCMAKAAGRL